MTEQYFKHSPQAMSDQNQVENLAIEVEDAFLKVERDLWNSSVSTASLGSSIGNLDTWYLRDYVPDNGTILNYEQELYFPKYAKEASLDLIPDMTVTALNTVVIKNRLNPSQVYTYKHDGILQNDSDYCFVNRKIILGKAPTNNKTLTIAYNGYEPVDARDIGLDLRYNILQATVNGKVVKEFTNTVIGNVYKISGYNFKNMCSKDMISVINNHPYDLDKFVSISDIHGENSFEVKNVTITNTYISFESDDTIPEKVKIYIANSNLGKLVEGIYRLFYSHNHGNDGGRLITHADNVGLFNNTDSINYTVTSKENYDHPQYLNREGYIEAPEVYNNAMLGDLLVASKDKSNFYNNLSDDSFKIIFGEYASGHRVGYSKDTDSLVIDSLSRDGVKLVSPKNKNIFELNGHSFTDSVDGDYSGLRLSLVPTEIGAKELAVFSIKKAVTTSGGVVHEDSAELHVFSSTFSITRVKDELRLLNSAILSFGTTPTIEMFHNETGLHLTDVSKDSTESFSINLPLKTTKVSSDHIDAKEIHITDTQRIHFGDTTHLSITDPQTLSFNSSRGQVEVDTLKPVYFKQNGYESGIALSNTNKLFASTGQGLSTSNLSEKLDTYIQGNGDVYLIKNNFEYTSGGVNLQSVDKANMYAGDITSNNINVVYSDTKQNSVKLNGDTHRLFAQKDMQGNTAMQLQSSGGVNVVSGYSVVGSEVKITYGNIRASEFRAEGGGDNSGFYGNIIVPTGSKLTINGKAQINTEMELNNNLTVNGVSRLNTLETTTVKSATVSATESIVTPLITAPLGFESKLYFGADTVFNNSALFKQVSTFTSNCEFAAAISANTINTKFLYVSSAVDFPKITTTDAVVSNTLQFKKMLQSDNTITSEFSGPLLLKAGLALDRSTYIRLGSADIVNTRNTAGVLVTENAIKLGNNSTVKATKIFANKGLPTGGNSDISGGFSFETNLGDSDGDTGFFCTNKGAGALSDDLTFYVNGNKCGELSTVPLNLAGSIVGREKTLVTAEMIKGQTDGLLGSVLSMVYPIGSVYINANDNRNPKEVLNWSTSVWARFGIGMTLVGAEGTANSEKMAAMWGKPASVSLILEKEFGAFQHTLTEDELPEHWHGFAGDDELGSIGAERYRTQQGWDAKSNTGGGYNSGWYKTTGVGKNTPHNIVQPSVVVSMWRRIG